MVLKTSIELFPFFLLSVKETTGRETERKIFYLNDVVKLIPLSHEKQKHIVLINIRISLYQKSLVCNLLFMLLV